MRDHCHNIYVGETVTNVAKFLRSQGFAVEYEPNATNPEVPNAYVGADGQTVVSSCIRWRTCGNARLEKTTPQAASACLQVYSTDVEFEALRRAAQQLNIVQECSDC